MRGYLPLFQFYMPSTQSMGRRVSMAFLNSTRKVRTGMKLLIFSNSLELYNKTKHVCSEYRELKTVNEMSGMMRECT